jgi:hypothetical protein
MAPKIIFDVATKPFAWEPMWAAIVGFLFGCVLIVLKKLKWRHAMSISVGFVFMLAAVVYAGRDATRWYISRQHNVKALTSGQYKIAQGVVETFHPMPDDGSSNESFTVSGYAFSYSDYSELTPSTCFNQTAAHGGPIHPGMLLRIKFVDQCILQIEVLPENSAEGATKTGASTN